MVFDEFKRSFHKRDKIVQDVEEDSAWSDFIV